MIKAILAELARPDSQGNDWYAWASNQLSHALFGVLLALHFEDGLLVALIVALLKETADVVRSPTRATVIDSAFDAAFWLLGAWLIVADDRVAATILLGFALLIGVKLRLRRGA